MVRRLSLPAGMFGAVLIAGLGVAVLSARPAAGPVYTVAGLRERLAAQPDAWAGRTVVVRGMAEPCPWWGGGARLWQCADEPLVLVAGPFDAVAEPLPLGQTAPGTALAFLRDVPILHEVLARPRAVPVFTPSRFRVRLQGLAAQSCGGRSPCYAALLLDVAPVASKEL